MSLIMAENSQPLFRDFLGTGHKTVAKQPEMSVTDSVRILQQKSAGGAGCDEGEVSTKVCSVHSAPPSPFAGASAPVSLPNSTNPSSECWKHVKTGATANHGSKGPTHKDDEHDHGKKRDYLAGRDLFLNSETSQSSRPSKVFRSKEEDLKTGNDHTSSMPGDLRLSMQPPRPSTTTGGPLWMQTSVFKTDLSTGASKKVESSRPVVLNSALPLSNGISGRFKPVRVTTSDEKALPKENVGGFSLLQQPPADEGSRTGLQGAGLAHLLNSAPSKVVNADLVAQAAAPLPTKLLSRNGSQSAAPSLHHMAPPATRQLTIFYGGQAHVFDDVSPEKADEIMSLAGSNGRSWSTSYANQPSASKHSLASQSLELEKEKERPISVGTSLNKAMTHMLPSDDRSLLQELARAGGGAQTGNLYQRQDLSSARSSSGLQQIAENPAVDTSKMDGSAIRISGTAASHNNMNGKEAGCKGQQEWM